MTQPLLVLCTCPDPASSEQIAAALLNERLAAGVNQIDNVISRFHWQGEVQHSEELLLLIQTNEKNYPALEGRIKGLHPYEVPKIIAFDIAKGLPSYLDWINTSCG